ncbi:MAG TPA: biopolymer transporter ExbD [Pirellulaceae bacterium]|jgi:biopolymer transport protein ExbD|nr:biopolymer transporter ExbD [Pirellulaceae bacterium]
MRSTSDFLSEGSDFAPKKSLVSEDDEIDITPMIDCVFLLLIFFIVTSKMEEQANVNLPPANYGVAVSMNNALVLTIDAADDGSAVIYLGESVNPATRVAVTDLEEQEQQILNYVEARLGDSPEPTAIVIQAAAKLKHREVGRVLKAIGQADTEIENIHLAVMNEG